MEVLTKNGRGYLCTQVHVSCVFFLIFTAYKSLESIQSSLNFEAGLGTISISLVYASYFLSSLLIGAPVVYLLKPKWTLVFTLFSHTIFIVANIWPSWQTMVPASIFMGLLAGPYWIAQGTYMTVLASRYAATTGEAMDQVMAKFSAIFHVIWGASAPVGNFLTSLVLNFESSEGHNNCTGTDIGTFQHNFTDYGYDSTAEVINGTIITNCSSVSTSKTLDVCGANHCPYMEEHLSVLKKPSQTLIYILMGIFLGFNILGISLSVCLKSIHSTQQSGLKERVFSTLVLIKDPNLLLLIAPICLIGIIPGTFYASFAQSFIACPFGIGVVGYAMMCEGIGFTVASLICAPLTKYIPRPFHVAATILVFFANSVGWLFWQPQEGQVSIVIVISLVYGAMHGIFRTLIAGLVSLLFVDNPEAGFAHYNIWIAIAYSISFAYTTYLCFNVKTYIFIGSLFVTSICYVFLEVRIRKQKVTRCPKSVHEKTVEGESMMDT